MNERRRVLTLLLVVGFVTYADACETLGLSSQPPTGSLRTDSAEIGVHRSGFAYLAKIGFVYVNTTSKPVSQPGHHTGPELLVGSIDGTYRLRWDFVEGTDATVQGARMVSAVSNEFRMVVSER